MPALMVAMMNCFLGGGGAVHGKACWVIVYYTVTRIHDPEPLKTNIVHLLIQACIAHFLQTNMS